MVPMLPHLGQAAMNAQRPQQQPSRQGLLGQTRSAIGGLLGGVQNQFRNAQESDEGFNLLRFRPPEGMRQSEMIMLAGAGLQDLDPMFGGGRMQAAQQTIDQRMQGRQAEEQRRAQQEQMQAFRATLPPEQQQMFDMNPEGFMTQMTQAEFRAPPQDPTAVREYQLAQQQGFEGSFMDFDAQRRAASRPQTTVNLPGQPMIGSIPPGFEAVRDPETGSFRMQPIPGGPADRQIQGEEDAEQNRVRNARDYARTVVDDLSVARGALESLSGPSTWNNPVGGQIAETLSNVPRTAEFSLRQFFESALNNVTLDTMNRMRESSPSGATGMGNMSDAQLRTIRGVLGQWHPGLPVEEQRYLMDRLHNFYMDAIVGERSEREKAVREGRMTQAEADAYDEFYLPLVTPRSQGRGRQQEQSRPDPLGLRGGR